MRARGVLPARLPELDLLRAVALLCVGVIHAGAWITPAEAPPWQNGLAAASALARFSVPGFVFASGFALFHGYAGRSVRPVEFLRRRLVRILLPWACFVPVFLALGSARGDPRLRADAVGQWLASGPGHLYFLVLIAQLCVAFLMLPRDPAKLARATGALLALQLALMAWRTYGPLPSGALAWPGIYSAIEEAPFWLGTFTLGCLAAAEWRRLTAFDRWWPVGVLGSIAAAALVLAEARLVPAGPLREGSAGFLWPTRLAQTATWALTLLWLGRRMYPRAAGAWRPVRELSGRSLGIYLLHPIALDVAGPHTQALPPAIRVPALIVVSFAAAYAAVWLLARSRPTAVAVGERAPPLLQGRPTRMAA